VDDKQQHEDFTRFVHATGPRLHRSALLLSGDAHLAEDLVQTTYAKLFASWRRVQAAGNPVGYAHTTLTNVFLSHKRLRRSGERPTDEVGADTHAPESSSDGRLDLLAALRTLPPTDRAVVVLRYWEDRTVSETAHALGLTDDAVRSRASRSLARLRPHLTMQEMS
jgi:RNA polymerase sigma-70 factor (sigma-E family)